jgi:hypothetical protein
VDEQKISILAMRQKFNRRIRLTDVGLETDWQIGVVRSEMIARRKPACRNAGAGKNSCGTGKTPGVHGKRHNN